MKTGVNKGVQSRQTQTRIYSLSRNSLQDGSKSRTSCVHPPTVSSLRLVAPTVEAMSVVMSVVSIFLSVNSDQKISKLFFSLLLASHPILQVHQFKRPHVLFVLDVFKVNKNSCE